MNETATDFKGLLRRLLESRVEFIIVGGVACNVHGSARATFDVDVVYARTADNIDRLVNALAPIQRYLRGAPRGLPFTFDAKTTRAGLNFTLITSLGDIDLPGEYHRRRDVRAVVAGNGPGRPVRLPLSMCHAREVDSSEASGWANEGS